MYLPALTIYGLTVSLKFPSRLRSVKMGVNSDNDAWQNHCRTEAKNRIQNHVGSGPLDLVMVADGSQ